MVLIQSAPGAQGYDVVLKDMHEEANSLAVPFSEISYRLKSA